MHFVHTHTSSSFTTASNLESQKRTPPFGEVLFKYLSDLHAVVKLELVWVRTKSKRLDFLLALVVNPGFD